MLRSLRRLRLHRGFAGFSVRGFDCDGPLQAIPRTPVRNSQGTENKLLTLANKSAHQVPSVGERDGRSGGTDFAVSRSGVRRDSRTAHRKRAVAVTVRASSQKRWMIRTNQQSIVALLFQPGMQWSHDMAIDVLNRFDLFMNMTFMRSLIGRFHVHHDEVFIRSRQSLDRCSTFRGIVRIQITWSAEKVSGTVVLNPRSALRPIGDFQAQYLCRGGCPRVVAKW